MYTCCHSTSRDSLFGTAWLCRLLVIATTLIALAACGGGGGGSTGGGAGGGGTGGGGGGGGTVPTGSITYPSGTQTGVVGTPITAIVPTLTGSPGGFSTTPALPPGLAIDYNLGTIYGTPTAITAAATYTVSAVIGPAHNTTITGTVSIAVTDVAPANLSYGAQSLTYSATVPGTTLTPKVAGGPVVTWSIAPATLPAGLTFSTTDGSISGTPSAATASAGYVVTAQNSGGQSTVNLTIAVDVPPVVNLGHQYGVTALRETATNVLSVDIAGNWILWGYTGANIIVQGNSGCGFANMSNSEQCALTPIDLAGPTAVVVTPTGFEALSSTDGHVLGTITVTTTAAATPYWWKLASDGSYIVVGAKAALSVYSTAGNLLFTRPGDYSQAVGFAAPGDVLVAGGPAGGAVETIVVPAGTSSTGPAYNGQAVSWFTDGSRFITKAGATALVYSNAGAQQASVTLPSASATVAGQGNWIWTYPSPGAVLNIYSAVGTNPAASASYTFPGGLSQPYASGTTIGVVTQDGTTVSVIDLSGGAPTKTDYNTQGVAGGTYVAVSASQWLLGSQAGVVADGPTFSATPRFFGLGQVLSMAGGSAHFALATASGSIVYFNSATLAQEGQIAFAAKKVLLSADGTLLAAQSADSTGGVMTVQIYAIPAGTLQYTWSYNTTTTGVAVDDIVLSSSGNLLGQVLFTEVPPGSNPTSLSYTQQASAPTGGSAVFTSTFSATNGAFPPPMRISPDGTLIAASQYGANMTGQSLPGTNLYLNGNLVTAFNGLPAGWLDGSRLLVDNYAYQTNVLKYTSCTLYGNDGAPTGAPCALPVEVSQPQLVTGDTVYSPTANKIFSVSSGAVTWMSADPFAAAGGAVGGAHVIFVSGTYLLAQSF